MLRSEERQGGGELMDLDQLRLFVDLVREQSFTRVAAKNFVSQPAVSLRLQKLEEELGARLLDRTRRRMVITEEGRILYDYACQILEKADEMREVLRDRQDRPSGSIRLCTVNSIGLYEFPPVLTEFIRRHPEVHLHIDYRLSDQVYQAVAEGAADLGLVAYPEARGGIRVVPFLEDELVLICNKRHPLAGRAEVPLEALSGTPLIAFEPEIPTRKATDSLLAEARVPVNIRLQCDNLEVMKKMVEVGLGVAFVPRLSVREEARRGTLCVIHIEGRRIPRSLAVVHRSGRTLTRAQTALLDLLVNEGATLLARSLEREE